MSKLEEKIVMAPPMSPTRKSTSSSEIKAQQTKSGENDASVQLRIANRKRIKKIDENEEATEDVNDKDTDDGNFVSNGRSQKPVTGSDLLTVGVRNSVVVEHLVQDLMDKSSMQEFSHSFNNSPRPSSKNHGNKRRSLLMENKLQEFEIEMERLSSRMEHLKSQNEVLNLTLIESKNHCDNLTVLIGKYESNHTAQSLIISFLDHIIESFEVLVNLLESHHQSNQSPVLKLDKSSSRQVAENLAKKLIKRLDSVIRPDSGLAQASGSSLESSAWTEDSSGYTTSSASPSLGSNGGGSGIIGMTTSSIGSFVFTSDPANNKTSNQEEKTTLTVHEHDPKSLESKVREIISQLRSARSSVQSTITELESHHPEYGSLPHPPAKGQDQKSESKTAELEMAVLVQVGFFFL